MRPNITLAKYLKRLLLCLTILLVHYFSVFAPISELFYSILFFQAEMVLRIFNLEGLAATGLENLLF
jgi:hypothetical protein